MTEELKQKAYNFLEKHTYYDECKGKHYRDLTEMELLVLFAEETTKELQEKFDKRLKRHCNTIHTLVDELERRQNAEKELQEEIATLKHNKKTVAHLSSCISDVQEKKIEELQAENKKLDTMLTGESLISSERKDKLTKAKELLKKYMKISEENGRQWNEEVYFETREFLNSEVEK